MEALRIHFAFLENAPLKDYERKWPAGLKKELAPHAEKREIIYAERPDEADIIVLLESGLDKKRSYLKALSQDSNLRRHWQKVFTINYEDQPQGFLQGLYSSICPPNYNAALHRPWPPLYLPCGHVYQVTDDRIRAQKPALLFSFLGSKSHPIRQKILSLYSSDRTGEVQVEEVDKWFNHNAGEKSKYVEVSLNSRFVLCPRGFAPFTYRICEAMALGRVPVVIADDWLPFAFAENLPYYVRIPETQIDRIGGILREADSYAEEYGSNARKLWTTYCSPVTRMRAAVMAIAKLKSEGTGPQTYEACKSQWASRQVLKQNGWTLGQRLSRKLHRLIKGLHLT